MSLRRLLFALLAVLAVFATNARAEKLTAVGWNLESGEASSSFISNQIAGFQGIDLWGFTEVRANDAPIYAAACAVGETGQTFQHFVGTTGGSDRMVIVFNATKLELVETQELHEHSAVTGRAPLFGVFKIKTTGEQFIFMVNHLHRTKAAKRMQQAVGVEAWAKTQTLPAVLVGDYNFDVNVTTKQGNASFVAFTDENVFRWIEPTPFRATHKSGGVLDFVFLSGTAKTWTAQSEVTALADDAADTLEGSDHRPVFAKLETAVTPTPAPAGTITAAAARTEPRTLELAEASARQHKRNEILRQLAVMEQELVKLRRMVKELGDE